MVTNEDVIIRAFLPLFIRAPNNMSLNSPIRSGFSVPIHVLASCSFISIVIIFAALLDSLYSYISAAHSSSHFCVYLKGLCHEMNIILDVQSLRSVYALVVFKILFVFKLRKSNANVFLLL
jgi:hypothetical protein